MHFFHITFNRIHMFGHTSFRLFCISVDDCLNKPMMLVINSSQMDGEQQILDIVGKYSKSYKVKSRNLTAGALDMVVEVQVKEEGAFVKEVAAVDTVMTASLIAHDGEVTF